MAPTATAALGRTLLGAVLIGAYRKEDEQIQVSKRSSYWLASGAALWLADVSKWGSSLAS